MAAPLPPPPPPPDPAVLIDELVEEFLLPLPPEDPAVLARAALVSRQWYRVVTGPSFRRRFREFHRSTPLLGYILNLADSIRFVSLSSFRPPHTHRQGVRAVSSSHGRVLLHRLSGEDLIAPRFPVTDLDVRLSVWHPITDEQQDLPVVPLRPNRALNMANWDAAVICAAGDGCDHLHCHFVVVFVGMREDRIFSCFYSSQAGSWSDPVFYEEEEEGFDRCFVSGNCIVIGTALYTTCSARDEIFKLHLHSVILSCGSTPRSPRRTRSGCSALLRLDAEREERMERRRKELAAEKEREEEARLRHLAAFREEKEKKFERARRAKAAMESNPDAFGKGK